MKKIMIIAGETSGDIHGEKVVKELKKQDVHTKIFGIGGDRMEAAGMELVYHVGKMSFLGFVEVIRHLPFIAKVMNHLTQLLEERKPDLLILIDYPGFNLRFAKRAHQRGIPVLYYISPQVWAWNTGRVHKIAKVVDKMAVIFPFEVATYKDVDLDVEFVGHPLLEEINFEAIPGKEALCKSKNLDSTKQILGILPGSRKQEIQRIFPILLKSAEKLYQQLDQELEILVGVAPDISLEYIQKYTEKCGVPITCIKGQTYGIMNSADLLMVKSGTSTLESALFATPMLVVYRVNWLSYQIGKRVVQIPNIGLVNVVAGETIAPEFIQHDVTPDKIVPTAYKLLTDKKQREKMITQLKKVRQKLGEKGASAKVAKIAQQIMENRRSNHD